MTEPEKPLDYAAPPPPPPRNMPLQVLGACFAATAGIGIAAFIGGYVAFAIGYGERGRPQLATLVLLLIMGIAIGAVIINALRARRHPRRRGVQLGLWLGLGVGLLVTGLCFTAM